MAIPNLTDYFTPDKPGEVIELLQRFGDDAMIVAGGTFVHGLEARGLLSEVQALIDIQKLGLTSVSDDGSQISLGAATNFATLAATEFVQNDPAFGAVRDALEYPPAQIRNAGTVGGCVCASAPLYDVPATLLALDGSVTAHGASGAREIALGDFFVGLFENALSSDEFITELRIPRPAANTASAFLKLETNANDLAILNVAVRFTRDSAGNCQDARVIVGGGVGETYARAGGAEAALNGSPASEATFAAAAEAVAGDITTVDDHRGSAAYRRHIAKIFTQRTLATALERLG